MKTYIINRLKEASTWRGIVLVLTAAGIPLAPLQAEAVIALGLAAAGIIGAAVPDKKNG